MIKTAIISDLHDWHSNKIEYFLKKNGCSVIKLSFEEIEFYFKNNKKKIFKNNISNVDSVWVRFIKNGSLEEITTKLTFLHLLQNLKVYTHNSANVIEKTVDKIRTTGLLKINGIDSPNTTVWIGKKKIKLEKTSLIKPIFGSQGKGIKLIRKGEIVKDNKGFKIALLFKNFSSEVISFSEIFQLSFFFKKNILN